jgi:DNA repair protein RadC
VEYAASALVLVHNHPSGSLTPSPEDIAVTKQLLEAGKTIGIELLDHIIVGEDGFVTVMDHIKE